MSTTLPQVSGTLYPDPINGQLDTEALSSALRVLAMKVGGPRSTVTKMLPYDIRSFQSVRVTDDRSLGAVNWTLVEMSAVTELSVLVGRCLE